MSNEEQKDLPKGVVLKEHSYDGIQEYDQRLPRWWLLTLYGAIIFSAVFFMIDKYYSGSESSSERVESELRQINAIRLASSIDVSDNEMYWEMSQISTFTESGEKLFQSTCSACHGANLEGGIGFNLVDGEWIHGAAPSEIYQTIYDGVPNTGMQAWGTTLGQKRITEIVAFILSKNDETSMRASAAQEQ
tara:strand:- start:10339 stop:10908 length:570 start_codon:yes stop_codon:yes gene_type:complete